MEASKLVHRANQVAAFFAPYPREEAIAGVAEHLSRFWAPPLRREIIDYVAAGGAGLSDLVVEAVRRLAVPA